MEPETFARSGTIVRKTEKSKRASASNLVAARARRHASVKPCNCTPNADGRHRSTCPVRIREYQLNRNKAEKTP